jgi:ABC-type sugar transport system permease subunit
MLQIKKMASLKAILSGYLFILPAVILVAVFLIYPIGFVIYIGFFKWGIIGTPKFIGLENFVTLFQDKNLWIAIKNTIFYLILSVPSQMGLGMLLAFLVNKKGIVGREFFRTIFFIPLSVSFVAAGILFNWILTTQPIPGFLPELFTRFGLPFPQWQTTDPAWAMVMIVIMNVWKSCGIQWLFT